MKVLHQECGKDWVIYHGDSAEVMKGIPTDSTHLSLSSIPFASLYTYSNSERDLGNCKNYSEFGMQFTKFIIPEWVRITMPGRLIAIHCMNLPTTKEHHGYIGLQDFRGDIIRWFESAGMIYHSEVCIWKDPVTAMQRTKALGLLHKQLKKDSCMSRQGVPDYLVVFRKPGENPERCTHTNDTFPVREWQKYASPIWMDINQSDTLQRESAREEKDERHICPLQLEVIERAIQLWSNPGDIIFDPFVGIGSVPYIAVKMGRRGVGIELKESYYNQAVANCKAAEAMAKQVSMFSGAIS